MKSSKWSMTDNIYVLNRQTVVPDVTVGVEKDVVEFAKTHSKRETYLYNNRRLFMYINPSKERKDQYHRNWEYINKLP